VVPQPVHATHGWQARPGEETRADRVAAEVEDAYDDARGQGLVPTRRHIAPRAIESGAPALATFARAGREVEWVDQYRPPNHRQVVKQRSRRAKQPVRMVIVVVVTIRELRWKFRVGTGGSGSDCALPAGARICPAAP
jgi:hypothetical protein